MRKKRVVTDPELKEAWETVAKYLNDHKEISFYVSPWTLGRGRRSFTLHYLDDDGNEVALATANSTWKR